VQVGVHHHVRITVGADEGKTRALRGDSTGGSAALMAALLAAGLYRMASSLLGAKSPQASPGTNTSSLDKPPRPLTPEERAFLERLHGGRSFEGVKVDEGFLFDSQVGGVVRSDKEINVRGGFSLMSKERQLALLAHESTHIVQRQLGTLDNFRGAFAHAWAWLTGTDLYAIPADFKGSFFDLNFEQQAVVVENAARIKLGTDLNRYGAALGKVRVFQLYKEYLETVRPR
jgi:hypothetical protein